MKKQIKKIRFEKPSNAKRIPTNQLSSVPSLKYQKIRFFDNSSRCRSQVIHSTSPNSNTKSSKAASLVSVFVECINGFVLSFTRKHSY